MNKTILITGASSGIGKGCATKFASHGARLILNARSTDKLTALAQELKEKYNELSILIGADMITTFFSWYRYRDILSLCEIVAVRRPGIDDRSFDKAVETLRSEGGNITILDAKMPNVSSTDIREDTDDETQLSKKVPSNIYEYIAKNKLYFTK